MKFSYLWSRAISDLDRRLSPRFGNCVHDWLWFLKLWHDEQTSRWSMFQNVEKILLPQFPVRCLWPAGKCYFYLATNLKIVNRPIKYIRLKLPGRALNISSQWYPWQQEKMLRCSVWTHRYRVVITRLKGKNVLRWTGHGFMVDATLYGENEHHTISGTIFLSLFLNKISSLFFPLLPCSFQLSRPWK